VFILPASLVGASAIFVHNLLRGRLPKHHRRRLRPGDRVRRNGARAGAMAVRATMYGYVSVYLVLDTLITIAIFAVLMAAC
jgi:hypothetical protein